MEITRSLLLILHFIGMAGLLGGLLASSKSLNKGVLHSSLLALVAGLGLVGIRYPLNEASISQRIKSKLSDFKLDAVQMTRGHRSLSDFTSSTTALIFNFIWDSKSGDYLWSSYCQICGEVLVEKANEVAKAFTQSHNASCLEK